MVQVVFEYQALIVFPPRKASQPPVLAPNPVHASAADATSICYISSQKCLFEQNPLALCGDSTLTRHIGSRTKEAVEPWCWE